MNEMQSLLKELYVRYGWTKVIRILPCMVTDNPAHSPKDIEKALADKFITNGVFSADKFKRAVTCALDGYEHVANAYLPRTKCAI